MHKQYKNGFTIVELLIVIVVIAVLAAITIVSYTGIRDRAVASAAMSDLSNLEKAIQILNVDSISYTADATWNKVLHAASLYKETEAEPIGSKSFAICSNSNTYAVGAWKPMKNDETNNKPTLYLKLGEGIKTFNWNSSAPGGSTLARFCTQILPDATYRQWSFNSYIRD